MSVPKWIQSVVQPLASRKVRVAMVTVVAAYLARCGLELDEQIVDTVLCVGVALILGIAHEDNGLKQSQQTAQ